MSTWPFRAPRHACTVLHSPFPGLGRLAADRIGSRRSARRRCSMRLGDWLAERQTGSGRDRARACVSARRCVRALAHERLGDNGCVPCARTSALACVSACACVGQAWVAVDRTTGQLKRAERGAQVVLQSNRTISRGRRVSRRDLVRRGCVRAYKHRRAAATVCAASRAAGGGWGGVYLVPLVSAMALSHGGGAPSESDGMSWRCPPRRAPSRVALAVLPLRRGRWRGPGQRRSAPHLSVVRNCGSMWMYTYD